MSDQTNYDLNLLRAFTALYSERNVTRAASLANISQPAMSNLLARLRDLFNDPLFIRDRYGISPTEKADQLFPGIQRSLQHLDTLVRAERVFEPATTRRQFALCVNDYFEFILLPTLIRRVRA